MYKLLSIIILFSHLTFSHSQEKALPFNIESSIKEVDAAIAQRENYMEEKENRIGEIRKQLQTHSNAIQTYRLYDSLFDEYKSYKYDSAYLYAQKALEIGTRLDDPLLISAAKEHTAFCYLSAGLFKEASDIMDSIDIDIIPDSLRVPYYKLYARLYYDMADYAGPGSLRKQYIEAGNRSSDSAIVRLPMESPELWSILGLKRMQQKTYDGASEAFLRLIHSPGIDNHTYAIATSSLGFIHLERGNTDQAIYYLAQAAIGDIKSATKETVALRNLASLLYAKGHIQKANDYVRLAMEDANFYNARHRKIEISSILPIIEKERVDTLERDRRFLITSTTIISILFILFFIATIIIYKQIKKIRAARSVIEEKNNHLNQTNIKLSEANKIKDEYIIQALYGNSEYIDRLENLYKRINRKIMTRQYDDILSMTKESDLKKDRENMHLSFDQTFLKIFPDFIEEYNKLFSPQDAVEIDLNKGLTPEIRIFALIRLGITESDRIAKFLDYSVNTINSYKTKVKNKSIVPNELFEQKIMEI